MLVDWRCLLEASSGANAWPDSAFQPAGEVARRRIWKLYRRFLRGGAKIDADFPDVNLHRLRITGKKLRYLIEFFRGLYPPAEIDLLIKGMKGVQDYLGVYQDYTVQQNRLNELDLQMAAQGSLPPETHEALALLVERLRQHQHQIRVEFNDRLRTFSHGRSRRGFLRLYAPKEMSA